MTVHTQAGTDGPCEYCDHDGILYEDWDMILCEDCFIDALDSMYAEIQVERYLENRWDEGRDSRGYYHA